MRLDYDELRKIYRLEKNNSRLAEVDEDFLDSLNDFFKAQKKDYLKSLNDMSSVKAKTFSNLKKIIGEIFSIREKKLLNKALIASRTGDLEKEPMSLQEAQTLDALLLVLNKHQAILDSVFNGQTASDKNDSGKISLKIIQSVPAFMGADMKEYGPFTKDKAVALPEKIALLLVSRKLAERV